MPPRKGQKQAHHRGSDPPLPSLRAHLLHGSWQAEGQASAPPDPNCKHSYIIGPEQKGQAQGICELCGDSRMFVADYDKIFLWNIDHKRGMHTNLHGKPLIDKIVDSLLDAQASPEIEDAFYRRMRAGVYLRP